MKAARSKDTVELPSIIEADTGDDLTALRLEPDLDYVTALRTFVVPMLDFFEVGGELPTRLVIGRESRIPGSLRSIVWPRGGHGPMVVSSQVKNLLSDIEPSTHRFRQVEVVDERGQIATEPYHIVAPPPRIDCVVMDQTDWAGSMRKNLASSGRITLRASAISGRHLWCATTEPMFAFFASHALCQSFRDLGVTGWQIEREYAVVDTQS